MPKPETYGVPSVYAAGDVNRDGVCDGFDPQDWDDYNDYGAGALAVDLDINRDGVVDSADRALVQGHADWALWTSHGRGSVSRLHNRRGYAGYEYDPATQQWHVRHRVLVSEMGRWNRRDPLGYVDGMSVYEYVRSMPVVGMDPMGLSGELHGIPPWRWWVFRTWQDEFIFKYLLNWYLLGNGGQLDLGGTPAMVAWYLSYEHTSSAKMALDMRIELAAKHKARVLASQLNCYLPEGPNDLCDTYAFGFRLPVEGGEIGPGLGMWVVGGHFLYANAECYVAVACGNSIKYGWVQYSYQCNVRYLMKDKFADPFGTGGAYEVGTPFWYTLAWQEQLWGVGILEEFNWDASRCIRSQQQAIEQLTCPLSRSISGRLQPTTLRFRWVTRMLISRSQDT
ncbi:MAG: hypothetical protein KF864_03025 [Phycisphaeraceae bacterium]|nr:hypothetical protein [Phycisphaeraceae bacterium]